ncbi:MAG: acyl-CoA dehydrogenase [Anaerolineae bacterium]
MSRETVTTHLPGLLPFLPMLYVGWSDAVLAPSQVAAISAQIKTQDWLTEAEKMQLCRWLDPTAPPSALEMKRWLFQIRAVAAQLPPDSRRTLADLGLQMAQTISGEAISRCSSPHACAALEEIEAALGIVSWEAVRSLVTEEKRPLPAAIVPQEAGFSIPAMTRLLDGDHIELRQKVRRLLTDPIFHEGASPDKAVYRETVLRWAKLLADQGLGALSYPTAYGGTGDITQYLAAMETLSTHDLSLVIKFGVQFGLFGGSIYLLGSERHHRKYLADVGTLALPGCFAMTELGHGSNVRDLQTVARYDRETESFIIHTPTEAARKEYIGNAAQHGRLATVFAQLEIDGEHYGVNAFLVPIRDESGQTLPGVRIADNGEKMGLNGVDNGRLWFDHVHIPRENMLNRFADVTADGTYESEIAGESRRFFTMIGTLVGGRVGIALSALSAAKTGLTIATRYANRRRQFGADGRSETLLLNYQTHQRRLMPLLANAYALNFALKYLVQRYAHRREADAREVETLAAALKAYSTWNTTHTLQTAREATGGQGYMAVNRIAALKADTDIFTTFEGDNTVLMQLVAKGRITRFRQQFHDMKLFGLVKYIAREAAESVTEHNPLQVRNTDPDHLLDGKFHLHAFRHREEMILSAAAKRLKKRLDQGMDSYAAFIQVQQHLVNLAHAFVERVILEQFLAGITAVNDKALAVTLTRLAQLFALSHIEQHKGWYLEHGYLSGVKSKAIRRQVDRLVYEISREAVPLVDAFGIPDEVLNAPIALE